MKNFRAFCADDKDFRREFRIPFSFGKFTYATNGHVAVRLDRRDEVNEATEAQAKIVGALDKFIADRLGGQSPEPFNQKLPDVQGGDDCERCEGTGKGHHDCPDCECDCADCDGTGTHTPTQRIRFEKFDINVKYLRLILDLPNPKIALSAGNDKVWPLLFSFDGGVGVLMPMLQNNPHGDEIFSVSDLEPFGEVQALMGEES